jgi:RNA recognition motif-containing protein
MIPESLNTVSMAATAGLAGLVAGLILGRLSAVTGAKASRRAESDEDGAFTGEGVELYVGNLSYDMTEPELKRTFGAYGDVLSVRIIKNKFNDRSKGYGFVEMAVQAGADKAVKAMHGKEIMGRKLVVNEARSRSRE